MYDPDLLWPGKLCGMTGLAERAEAALEGVDPAVCLVLIGELAAAQAGLRAKVESGAEGLADLIEVREWHGRLLEHVVALRLRSMNRIHASLARLRACTDVVSLLPAAAEELAMCCDFDRTVISRLRGSTWRAEAVWISPEVDPEVAAATRDYLTQTWTPLSRGQLETDLIRRRVAEVIDVTDPRTTKPLMKVSRSAGYVASPVMPSGRVIGFLQADCFGSDRSLTTNDRDNLWTFAEGFGLVYERTVLLERLQAQRSQVREAFVRAEAQLDEMDAEEIRLTRDALEPTLMTVPELRHLRAVAGSTLTVRERDVLELVVTGARNAEIADKLVIGGETVKTHLRGAMRKLGAATRAEAVARYLQLVPQDVG